VHGHLVAALFYAGPGAALSHATAAWWWRLTEARPPRIDISIQGRLVSVGNVCVHQKRHFERTRQGGLPVTPVARTLLDFASVAPLGSVRHAIAEADYLRLLRLEEIDAVLGRGSPGSAALRRVLQRHRPQYARTRSPLEDRFLDLCETHSIPLPEVNVKTLGFEVDAVWHEQRVIVELDGHAAHGTIPAVARDRDRELRLRAAGFVVLRYSWHQVTMRPALVAADLRRELGL
jgi:hypothetical protein